MGDTQQYQEFLIDPKNGLEELTTLESKALFHRIIIYLYISPLMISTIELIANNF